MAEVQAGEEHQPHHLAERRPVRLAPMGPNLMRRAEEQFREVRYQLTAVVSKTTAAGLDGSHNQAAGKAVSREPEVTIAI